MTNQSFLEFSEFTENMRLMQDKPALSPESKNPPPRQVGPYVWLCLAAGLASVLYRVLVLGQKEQSALMFIGLPTALAMLITFLPRSSSATGMIMKGISLFLLLLGILFIEGFVCILMAAPFFYALGIHRRNFRLQGEGAPGV
jgi:hypothetical protein